MEMKSSCGPTVSPLAETHTLTESHGEGTDPDRDLLFAETHTITKTNNESSDDDAGALAQSVRWNVGERRPLLFRDAVAPKGELPELRYDSSLSMSVDRDGIPLVFGVAADTMTHTAARSETDDDDK